MNAVMNTKLNTANNVAYNVYGTFTTTAIPTNTDRFVVLDNSTEPIINVEETGRYSVYDVANWFLKKEPMTHKKVQQLCYYAQAWAYALKGYRLEDTDFQAWVHGPVSPALWERFKSFGYDTIVIKGDLKFPFSAEDNQLLEDVWDTYGYNTGNALEALSHRELPWVEAREGYSPNERCSVVISPVTMAQYYKSIYSGD